MQPEERDPAHLLDIVLAARQAIAFVGDRDAARRVSSTFREGHPEVALAKATGMRNILVHEYGPVDVAEVWRTVRDDLRSLIAALEALLPPRPPDA